MTNSLNGDIIGVLRENTEFVRFSQNGGVVVRNVLIAGKTEQVCESIAALLTGQDIRTVCVTDGVQVRCMDVSGFDVVIISTPLADEFGLDLAAELRDKTRAAFIVLTKSEIADEVQRKIKFTGAFVIGRPCGKSALLQAIRFADVAAENLKRLEEENVQLERQLEDARVIGRAKACLMQYLSLTEEQAHRHIQKQAMDMRRTQRAVAEDILGMYAK